MQNMKRHDPEPNRFCSGDNSVCAREIRRDLLSQRDAACAYRSTVHGSRFSVGRREVVTGFTDACRLEINRAMKQLLNRPTIDTSTLQARHLGQTHPLLKKHGPPCWGDQAAWSESGVASAANNSSALNPVSRQSRRRRSADAECTPFTRFAIVGWLTPTRFANAF